MHVPPAGITSPHAEPLTSPSEHMLLTPASITPEPVNRVWKAHPRDVELRRFQDADAAPLAEFLVADQRANGPISTYLNVFPEVGNGPELVARTVELREIYGSDILSVTYRGKAAGMMGVQRPSRPDEHGRLRVRLVFSWLGAPYRGRGIMAIARRSVYNYLFAAGATEVDSLIDPLNTVSIALNEHLGAVRTGFEKSFAHYVMDRARWERLCRERATIELPPHDFAMHARTIAQAPDNGESRLLALLPHLRGDRLRRAILISVADKRSKLLQALAKTDDPALQQLIIRRADPYDAALTVLAHLPRRDPAVTAALHAKAAPESFAAHVLRTRAETVAA